MRDPIRSDGIRRRIAQYYLVSALGRGIAIICGPDVFGEHAPYAWNRFQKRISALFCLLLAGGAGVAVAVGQMAQALEYLIAKMLEQPSDSLLDSIENPLVSYTPCAVIAGVYDFFDRFHYPGDVLPGRERHLVQVMDFWLCLIIRVND